MPATLLGLFNIGGGEIVLLLALFGFLAISALAVVAIVFLILHFHRKSTVAAGSSAPPPLVSGPRKQ